MKPDDDDLMRERPGVAREMLGDHQRSPRDAKPVGEAFEDLMRDLGLADSAHMRIARNLLQLEGEEDRVMRELCDRQKRGTATAENLRTLDACYKALEHRAKLPPSAYAPLGPEREVPIADDMIERVTGMGIPALIAARIAYGTLPEHLDTVAMRAVRAFNENRNHSVLIAIGERGCGKSFAAAWWLVHGVHRVPPVVNPKKVTPRRFIDCDTIGTFDSQELLALADAKALVLDDAGTEDERYHADKVATMLARRYRNGQVTVVTTNLNERNFSARYGNRIADRVHEVGMFVVVGNKAEDSLRRKGIAP